MKSLNSAGHFGFVLAAMCLALLQTGCSFTQGNWITEGDGRESSYTEDSGAKGTLTEGSYKLLRDSLKDRRLHDALRHAEQVSLMQYPMENDTIADLIFITKVLEIFNSLNSNPWLMYEESGLPTEQLLEDKRVALYPKLAERLREIPAFGGNRSVLRYLFRQYCEAIADLAGRYEELYSSRLTINAEKLMDHLKPLLTDSDIEKILMHGPYSPVLLDEIKDPQERLRTCLENYGYLLAREQFEIDSQAIARRHMKDWPNLFIQADEARISSSAMCRVCNEISRKIEAMSRQTPTVMRAKPEQKQKPSKPEERDWLNMQPLELMKVE